MSVCENNDHAIFYSSLLTKQVLNRSTHVLFLWALCKYCKNGYDLGSSWLLSRDAEKFYMQV